MSSNFWNLHTVRQKSACLYLHNILKMSVCDRRIFRRGLVLLVCSFIELILNQFLYFFQIFEGDRLCQTPVICYQNEICTVQPLFKKFISQPLKFLLCQFPFQPQYAQPQFPIVHHPSLQPQGFLVVSSVSHKNVPPF